MQRGTAAAEAAGMVTAAAAAPLMPTRKIFLRLSVGKSPRAAPSRRLCTRGIAQRQTRHMTFGRESGGRGFEWQPDHLSTKRMLTSGPRDEKAPSREVFSIISASMIVTITASLATRA